MIAGGGRLWQLPMRKGLDGVWRGLSLARQYALASFAIILASMLAVGWWLNREIESGVTQNTAVTTALYTNSFVAPFLQELADGETLSQPSIDALERLLAETPLGERIVSIKIWAKGGRVVYASSPGLAGKVFTPKPNLVRAWKGDVVSELSDLVDDESAAERRLGRPLLETYSAVRQAGSGRIIAVAEFYELASDLERQIAHARIRGWLAVAAASAVIYLLLFGIVAQGSRTIARQQAELRARIGQLSAAAARNAELSQRIREASMRATELNERFLRRISAELHDGPAQGIGFALLKLDALAEHVAKPCAASSGASPDLDNIRSSLSEALKEIRDLCGGMALPELDDLPLSKVVQRAVRAHERKTGSAVGLKVDDLPERAPSALKICVYRLVQEALANAWLHGGGKDQQVTAALDDGHVRLEVSDGGRGFDPTGEASDSGHLGIMGMRRRVEELGGAFEVASRPGTGTRIRARLPMHGAEIAQ
jgi:signal transduction histidine kinase